MKAARLVVLGVAIAAGGLAALLAGGSDEKAPAPAPVAQIETVDVLVAQKDIGMGHAVAADDLKWQMWPTASAGPNMIRKTDRPNAIEELSGSIARGTFSTGEPIQEAKLIKANGSGYMAAVLPNGMRAISIEILPGDRGRRDSFFPATMSTSSCRAATRKPRNRTASKPIVSETILKNVRVLAIDQTVEEKNGQKVVVGKTATLELAPRQTEILSLGRQKGTLSLALRSIVDTAGKAESASDEASQNSVNIIRFGINPTSMRSRNETRNQHLKSDKRAIEKRTTNMAKRICDPDRVLCGADRHDRHSARQSRRRRRPPGRPARASRRALAGRCAGVPVIQVVGSDESSRFVPLGIGKSVVLDLPRDIKDVLVADPTIANAVVRSSRRAYIIGVKVGQTNMFFFDAEGRQIAGFDIAVKRDLGGLQAILKQALPGEDIRVEAVGDGIMLTGSVATPAQAQQAYDLANRVAASGGAGGFGGGGGGDKVINNIVVRGRDQVMIKVTVAEVQRDVIKQLGVDLSGSFNTGTAVVNFNQTNPFSAFGQSLSGSSVSASIRNVTATLQGDGARRRRAHAGRAECDRRLRRNRPVRRRRRIPGSERIVLRHHEIAAGLPAADRLQEIRRQPLLHAGRSGRRPHQPEGRHRSVRPLERKRDHASACPAPTRR